MIGPLPQLNPHPCCCPPPLMFSPPPFVEGIFIVEDIYFFGIVAECIAVVDIAYVDTKVALVQLAFAHHFSLSRCPLYFLTVDKILYNLFHRDQLIYKIYNID